MKYLIVLCVAVVCVSAFRIDGPSAEIIQKSYNINPDGSYLYTYKTSNGIFVHEHGDAPKTKPIDGPQRLDRPIGVRGRYSYTSPEGKEITVEYFADENGFEATGDHLPTPPPVPAAILRSLEYITAHPPKTN